MPTDLLKRLAGFRLNRLATRIDRYVLMEVATPFLGGVIFFCFIFMMFQVLRLADFFIVHGVSLPILGRMTGLLVMTFLPMAFPLAFLIGVLVGFGRLSADSELVAMKANGMSLVRLAFPVAALAGVVVAISLFLNLEWVPWAHRTFKSTLVKVSNTKVVSSIREGAFTSGFFDLLVYADRLDSTTNRLHRVFIYDERDPENPLTIIAKEGELVAVDTGDEYGNAAVLKLFDGSIHQSPAGSADYQKIDFTAYNHFLEARQKGNEAGTKLGMLTMEELEKRIDVAKPGSGVQRFSEAELWRRYAVALSPLFFVMIGMGFGTIRTRAVRAGAFLVGIVVMLTYWGLQTAGMVAAKKGVLPPFLALQLPNLILAAVGVKSFRSAMW